MKANYCRCLLSRMSRTPQATSVVNAIKNCCINYTLQQCLRTGCLFKLQVIVLFEFSHTKFDETKQTISVATIQQNFPQLQSLLPIIEARRQAVKQLQQTVQRARVNFAQPANNISTTTASSSSSNNNTVVSASTSSANNNNNNNATATVSSTATTVSDGPLTDVSSVGSLAVDIRNRRALAALLQASVR
jgi:activator of HSP90 ATPase